MAMKTRNLVPFEVTDNDHWVSFPLDGISPTLLVLGVHRHTGYGLHVSAFAPIMAAIKDALRHRCMYCTKRAVSRLFLILTPKDNHRLRGFVTCETCADQMRSEVAGV
jgi:hypothetical protein